ncbi:MAG: family 16 glycosylhydrolase [Granulosicoccus sp.]
MEDAEGGTTGSWVVYDRDPGGASIVNVLDEDLGSRVIALTGSGTSNGYRLGGTSSSSGFSIAGRNYATWRYKTSESVVFYIAVTTTNGYRYISYESRDIARGFVSNRYIFTGLGVPDNTDRWRTVERNLAADLEAAEPGNTLLAVHGFLVRGSMRLDDIFFSTEAPVANASPVVSAGADQSVELGQSVALSGTASDADGFVLGYEWRDSTGTVLATTPDFSFTPTSGSGDTTLTFTAFDDDGASASSALVITTRITQPSTIVFDAEDGTTNNWSVYDRSPAGASIVNVADVDLGSLVIALSGSGTSNGYRFGGTTSSSGFNITGRHHASWRYKSSQAAVFYIATTTTNGFRYISYESKDSGRGLVSDRFIFSGLGIPANTARWRTVERDLEADLQAAEPGNTLLAIHGFLVRGSMHIDDISFSTEAPPVNIAPSVFAGADQSIEAGQSAALSGTASDADGVILAYEWTDAIGTVLATTPDLNFTPASEAGDTTLIFTAFDDDGASASSTLVVTTSATQPSTVVFDSEDGAMDNWAVYDQSPAGASIANVPDTDLDSLVIELTGSGTGNGYRLGGATASSGFNITGRYHASWRYKSSESVVFYIAASTTNGYRYISYESRDVSRGLVSNRYIFTALGVPDNTGRWRTVERDLAADLEAAEPGNTLLAIHGFLVRGSMRLDDISFSTDAPPQNIAPDVFAGANQIIESGQSVVLSGTASDTDGTVQAYEWTDATGTVLATTPEFTFSPASGSGDTTLTFTAFDDDGASASDSIVISIQTTNSLPDLSQFSLVFSDEFNAPEGSSLDATKWDTGLLWGPYFPINNEEQLYVDSLGMHGDFDHTPFHLTGSTLKITATPTDASLQPPPRPAEDDPVWNPRSYSEYRYNGPTATTLGYQPSDINYLSGIITTYDSLKLTHGYVEMRAKLPAGRGLWPAFWLLNTHYVEDVPEIDVMEFLGQDVDRLYHTYHYFDIENDWSKVSTPSFQTFSSDWTQGFHTFGMAWSPTDIIWYVNGIETRRITSDEYTISNQAMYILANIAVGGNWPGAPDSYTVFPATFEIDYIRAYKRKLDPQLDLATDYQLMFEDEFNGSTLDADKWNTHFLWGPYLTINNEEQYYVDALGSDSDDTTLSNSPFVLNSGILSITARKASDLNSFQIPSSLPDINDPVWTSYPQFQRYAEYSPGNYTSGLITSYDGFKFSYGYAEIRAKVPAGDGLWPAFWLLNGYYVNRQPEIDVMEVRGEFPTQIVHSYHRLVDGVMSSESALTSTPSIDYSQAFHDYGVRWQPGRIDWYIDGSIVHSYAGDDVGYQVMYVLANLAVGGDFSNGTPVDASRFDEPTLVSLDIDYIRVYQEKHKD